MMRNLEKQNVLSQTRRRRPTRCCWWCRVVVGILALSFVAAIGAAYLLEKIGVPPRILAPYVAKRTSGHNPTIVSFGSWLAYAMMIQDRGNDVIPRPLPEALNRFRIGAQAANVPGPSHNPGGRVVDVASVPAALAAIAAAEPGDLITFAPGTYHFDASYIRVARPGRPESPIRVRAERLGAVRLEFAMAEGFLVVAPYWIFEDLHIVGSCKAHSDCEHAFHVVGNGHHFVSRNNTIIDFNSPFKINGQDGAIPDHGLLEFNTLTNTSVRQTANPVDVIDIVAASHWIVRKNFISDFFKGDGNRTSYGGFAKGGGSDNLFENNIVLCEDKLRNPGAITVGLSLGGGGTGAPYCRDKKCVTEQEGSTIRGNLIASCSNEGIYINKAAMSKVSHNTIIDTAGVSVRFPSSGADVEGNLVDGRIYVRDDAILRATDNMETSNVRLYLGSHPVRNFFDVTRDTSFTVVLPRRSGAKANVPVADLCGTVASGPHAYGAFDRFADCLR